MLINQDAWGVYCDIPVGNSAMTARVGFSHRDAEADETEFCISAWDAHDLSELFMDFCRENGFTDVTVLYVSIVRTAKTLDELTLIEERI